MSRPGPVAKRQRSAVRAPLSRERVLAAALELADREGIEAVSMRAVADPRGVKAMALYKHVEGKEAILDGLTDLVFAEMRPPPRDVGWREGLVTRALGMRKTLLTHRWAAGLVEARTSPSPGRLRYHDASLGLLLDSGFSLELAYAAILTQDSYVYGFVAQEVTWPFSPDERTELIEELAPAIDPSQYPNVVRMMGFVLGRGAKARRGSSSQAGYDADFAFGVELMLDGLERARRRKLR